MKKFKLIYGTIMLSILLWIAYSCIERPMNFEGEILFGMVNETNRNHRIYLYDCSTKDLRCLDLYSWQAMFLDDSTILSKYDEKSITKFNLDTNKEEDIVYSGDEFNHFSICDDSHLSLACCYDEYIYLYDMETKEKKVLVDDISSAIHSWSEDGSILYYSSDQNEMIKSFNVLTGESAELFPGNSPIVCGSRIAYEHNGSLIVRDMQTNKEYKFIGYAFSYAFSPDGEKLLVETHMAWRKIIPNLFKNEMIFGNRLVVWDYKNNNINTIVDAFDYYMSRSVGDWQ